MNFDEEIDMSKKTFPHYVHDGEEIVIDRRAFRMERSPKSTEHTEIILIKAIPENEVKK